MISLSPRLLSLSIVLPLLLVSVVSAHKPTFSSGDLADAGTAFEVADPDLSIVLYREVTCEHPQLWLTFEGVEDFELFVQVLIPQLERLQDYRPSVAVIGPGLPEVSDIGVAVPDGMGAIVFDSADVAQPVAFDEPFTDTHDWIVVEERLTLLGSGTHYVVAWDPGGQTGKLSLAIGETEMFDGDELVEMGDFWTEQARIFHETEDYPPAEEPQEHVCEEHLGEHNDDGHHDGEEATAADGGGSSSGCSLTGLHSGKGAPLAWLLGLALLVAYRRR